MFRRQKYYGGKNYYGGQSCAVKDVSSAEDAPAKGKRRSPAKLERLLVR